MKPFQINEKYLSQLPALQLLIGLGFEFLTPAEALRERQGEHPMSYWKRFCATSSKK
jgi:hypothetical protein